MFPKQTRVQNRALLDLYHDMPCCVCGVSPCDPSHIKTRGSGGPDEPWNILPKCRTHHREWGQWGWKKFLKAYPIVWMRMKFMGWKEIEGKLWHPKILKSPSQD